MSGPAKKPKESDGLDHVKTVLGLAKAGLTGIGIPGVEAIAAVPLEIIAIFETEKANKEDLKSLLTHINTLEEAVFAPIREARKRDGFRVPDDVDGRLKSLKEAFAKSKETITPFETLPRWRRVLKRTQIKAALKGAVENLSKAIAIFQAGGQVTVELLLQSVNTNVQDLRVNFRNHDAAAQKQASDAVLSKLQPVHGGFSVSDKTGCLENTREQLLSDIRRDLSRPEVAFVSLYGSPGVGKSAVAKSISTALRARGVLAASYFFDKSGSDKKSISVSTLISTLSYEFALVNRDFRAAVVAQLDKDPSLSSANKDTRFEKLFLTPVCSIPPPRRPFIIVLDALDECGGPDAQKALVELLRRCAQSPELRSRITFFLTSRPEPSITDTLERQELASIGVSYQMNILSEDQTRADIVLFVDHQLRKLRAEIKQPSTLPQHHEIVEFAGLAAGLFEIAALLVRQLRDYCENAVASLNDGIAYIHDLVRASSPHLQLTLPNVYSAILRTAYIGLSKWYPQPKILADYRTVVGALACLRQPLSMAALSSLIDVEVAVVVRLLRPLSSVIATPNGGPISFFHASFLDFLLSKPDGHDDNTAFLSNYLISSVESHPRLAKRSLFVMNELLHCNILGLANPVVDNKDIPDLPGALSHHVPEHLRYACLYWAEHLRVEDVLQCRDDLVVWCDKNMAFYLEVLSLLGELERGVPLLAMAEDWVHKAGNLAPTATLLNDCQRLVQMFYPAIAQSVSAVYSSAIAFMPSCNVLERYSRLAEGGPILIKGRLSAWPAQIWTTDCLHSVSSVTFCPDNRHIASGCADGLIRLLSAATGRIEQLLKGHADAVYSLAFSPDGARIISGSGDRTVRIWSAASGGQERVLEGHSDTVLSVAFSPDGARIVSGSGDHSVRVWSAVTGEQERLLEGHSDTVLSVAFSPDGTRIVSGSDDEMVRIWSVVTREQECVLEGHTDSVRSVAFSPDGARIISGSNDCTIRIWSAASGEQEQVLEGDSNTVLSVAFSPDGARIVSGSDDGTVRIWSAALGGQERVLEGHFDTVLSVAFSPDGARIVSGSDDGTVRIWSAASGEQERVLEGHTSSVNSVALSADGRVIMSMDIFDNTLFWDTGMGRRLDQDHSLAQLAFPEEAKASDLNDGWLRFNGLSVWLPRYIQGWWWSARDIVVIQSDGTLGRLAFIKLPSDAESDRT